MKYPEVVFHSVVLSCALGFFSSLAFAQPEQDYTLQIKCQQKDNGREVVCWMVEVPNKTVEEE